MIRYLAFLRGINISGKNKISMTELKYNFERLGFTQTSTYMNSGNIAFSSTIKSIDVITNNISIMIKNKFNLCIPVFIMLQEELEDILEHSPDWWGNEDKKIYNNIIFIIPPVTSAQVIEKIGQPENNIERIKDYKNTIFWSFVRKEYKKSKWWSKTSNIDISKKLTIRTANTVRKMISLK